MLEVHTVWLRITSLPRWVLAAAVLAIALGGYFGLLGARYWTASGSVDSLHREVTRLSAAVGQRQPDLEQHLSQVAAQEERLSAAQARLDYGARDDLPFLISETALLAPVEITSITVSEPSAATVAGLQYPTYGAVLTMAGSLDGLSEFLELLRRRAPGLSVGSLRVTGGEGTRLARLQLLFYGSPMTTTPPVGGR